MAGEPKKRISTWLQVKAAPVGMHVIGAGLYLSVNAPTAKNPRGSRQWIFRFTSPVTGKRREMGLGAAVEGGLTLDEAKNAAIDHKRAVTAGLDPIEEQRAAAEKARALVEFRPLTFGEFASEWVPNWINQQMKRGKFQNEKHRAQWTMTIERYAAPLLPKPISEITTQDVIAALAPIWDDKPETARRTQGRIERIFDAARVPGHLTGINPARWRGHLDAHFAGRTKSAQNHHPALPYKELATFMEALRAQKGTAARGLEFLILTAARSGELRGATWDEIDLEARRWTVPAHRMKAKKEHRVPLSDRAVTILQQMAEEHGQTGVVFPGATEGRPMSDMTLAAVLKRMKRTDITVHGFRSTFRDWAEDVSGFSFGIFKAALAHSIADKTDAAYRRSDAFEKRAKLMAAWASYADKAPNRAKVIPIRA